MCKVQSRDWQLGWGRDPNFHPQQPSGLEITQNEWKPYQNRKQNRTKCSFSFLIFGLRDQLCALQPPVWCAFIYSYFKMGVSWLSCIWNPNGTFVELDYEHLPQSPVLMAPLPLSQHGGQHLPFSLWERQVQKMWIICSHLIYVHTIYKALIWHNSLFSMSMDHVNLQASHSMRHLLISE